MLFYLSRGNWLLFVVPMLVLALGDALAALIGIAYGRMKYVTTEGAKSVEGSVAFFAVTFLAVHVPLLLFTSVGRAESLLIAVMIGLIVMMLEAIAWRGLDNVFIPLATWALLVIYLPLTPGALMLRVAVTAGFATFVFYWRGRSTMDDAGLLAVALYGYVVMMLGGPLWVIAPVVLFVTHVLRYPRQVHEGLRREAHLPPQARDGRVHSVRAVISICLPSLLCLLTYTATREPLLVVPHVVSFSAQLAKVCLSFHGLKHQKSPRFIHVGLTAMGAWGGTCLLTGLAIWLGLGGPPEISGAAWGWLAGTTFLLTLVPAALFCRLFGRLYQPTPRRAAIDLAGLLLSASAAMVAELMVQRL